MNQSFKKYTLLSSLVLATLLIVARLLLAPLSVNAINDWFAKAGVDSEIEDLSFDIYQGNLLLTGLRAGKKESRALSLDTLAVHWSWSALIDRQVLLNSIAISGLVLEAERMSNGNLVFAALDLTPDSRLESRQQEPATGTGNGRSVAMVNSAWTTGRQ